MKPLIIQGMRGLGDNIFARPFIRAAATRYSVWLDTPWPELYADLPIQFIRPVTRLRTQERNAAAQPAERWSQSPAGTPAIKIRYGHASLTAHGSITRALESQLPLYGAPYVFDLPDMGLSQVRRSVAFVRPVTLRREWSNPARNPYARHVNAIAEKLMATHHVVLVADLKEGEEWIVGPTPPHHTAFLNGELSVRELLALLRDSDIAVGGVGWIVPASIALGVKSFIVLGGQGAHNGPKVITDPRMNLSRIGFAVPEDYCKCAKMTHNCSKSISTLDQQWNSFARVHGLPCFRPSRAIDSHGGPILESATIPSAMV